MNLRLLRLSLLALLFACGGTTSQSQADAGQDGSSDSASQDTGSDTATQADGGGPSDASTLPDGTPISDAGTYQCGAIQCQLGTEVCFLPFNPKNPPTCAPLGTCTNCACLQMQVQCISACAQSGQEFFMQCK